MQSKLSSTACDASIPAANQRQPDYSMWQMYERYWMPFGKLLTDMEKEGMLVNRCERQLKAWSSANSSCHTATASLCL